MDRRRSHAGQETLDRFLADNGVRVVASLPCYTEGLVDRCEHRIAAKTWKA